MAPPVHRATVAVEQTGTEKVTDLFLCHFQITYIETSAKDPPMNVDKAFHELVRVIR